MDTRSRSIPKVGQRTRSCFFLIIIFSFFQVFTCTSAELLRVGGYNLKNIKLNIKTITLCFPSSSSTSSRRFAKQKRAKVNNKNKLYKFDRCYQ